MELDVRSPYEFTNIKRRDPSHRRQITHIIESRKKLSATVLELGYTNNKLFKIQLVIKSFIVNRLPRRDEILIHRLHVRHTYLTHSYILRRDTPPECEYCHVRLTVEHLLYHVAVAYL
jgi:hypothetical protein